METNSRNNGKSQHLTEILSGSGRLIIAGPCSAESREQLLDTAKALSADSRVNFLRAGIWKPRTTPGSFQGAGTEGLKWFNEVKKETGMPIATEVGSERHVYEALKHGVDLLWIGARTVSNPFTVQEIAEAIRGVDIPVLVKNPLCPDIDLWQGAINRFAKTGITQLGAIHRGFTPETKSAFRNQPNWAIPLMLRNRMPKLPIICDPSHIAGKENLVTLIAQRAISNGFDGLMVEVHNNPNEALTDASQQLYPKDFLLLLDKLHESNEQKNQKELLNELRLEIDNIDNTLVETLAERMELIKHIASIKKTHHLEVVQPTRWKKLIKRIIFEAGQKGLRPSFVKKLFNNIHEESCFFQQTNIKEIRRNEKSD